MTILLTLCSLNFKNCKMLHTFIYIQRYKNNEFHLNTSEHNKGEKRNRFIFFSPIPLKHY